MANSVNLAIIVGRLGQDPELRTTPMGDPVCTINVATNDSYKDRNEQWQERTEWHRIVLWGNLAERARKTLSKGSRVYIEGKIQYRDYEKDGEKRYITEIRASKFIPIDYEKATKEVAEDEVKYDVETESEDDLPF